jgi:hypothetical protein
MWHEDNMEKSDWIIYNGERIRARTLTKEQKQSYIASLNLPPYDTLPKTSVEVSPTCHGAALFNPLISPIRINLPIETRSKHLIFQ